MIRVAVISDSHGDLSLLPQAVPELGPVEWLLHAGDHIQDVEQIARGLAVEMDHVVAVVGNCDYPAHEPAQQIILLGGVRLWLTHGHHFGVKESLDRLYYGAKEREVRVAIFGHSHVPVCVNENGLLLFNPGSMSAPRRPQDPPSCGLIEIQDGVVTVRHIYLK